MKQYAALAGIAILLLMPSYVGAQSPSRIVVDDNLGDQMRGEHVWLHGQITAPVSGQYVIIQIANPRGDLCSIQQLEPLSGGSFVSNGVPLSGPLCGVEGSYDVRIFYGEYRASSSFTVGPAVEDTRSAEEQFANAKSVLDERISQTSSIDTEPFEFRASSITFPVGTITNASAVYADLLDASYSDRTFDGLDTNLRRAASAALDTVSTLEDTSTLEPQTASSIRKIIYTAIYYHEIGDASTSASHMVSAYSAIADADPTQATAPVSFASLKTTLLGLMQKSSAVLSLEMRDELSTILARGTAPVYADELRIILDTLTQARYLDITSQRDDALNSFVSREWELVEPLLRGASGIEAFVAHADSVGEIYKAAFLLRDLDKVERFIESGERGSIGVLLEPVWAELVSDLRGASSVEDILAQREAIGDMKEISEISSRLEQAVTLTRANRLSGELTERWPSLLDQISDASSLTEVRQIVGEFNDSIDFLRNAHSPTDLLKLEYDELLAKAERLSDRTAIANIKNAQSVLGLAEKISVGSLTPTKLDRIEFLLVWVAQQAEKLSRDLAEPTPEERRKIQAGILERAQSLENLAELGLRTQRFVPGYADYVDSVLDVVERTRALVINGELARADDLIRGATDDWREIQTAYLEIPPSSGSYGRVDIERREYEVHADDLESIADKFLIAGSAEHAEFLRLIGQVGGFVAHGNFVAAHDSITAAYEYAQEHLDIEHNSVIYDIGYVPALRTWLIEGFVEKQQFDRREDISIVVTRADGTVHERLEFADTKHGKFHVQFDAPHEPGVYVAELQWRNTSSSNIVYIPYETPTPDQTRDTEQYSGGAALIAISRDLYDLQEFMRGFGGQQYQANVGLITPVIDEAELAVQDRDESLARAKVDQVRELIERHLPLRSPEAVIRASYDGGTLNIVGALYKLVEFPEDIYIDIFDQRGGLETTVRLTDDADGKFSTNLQRNLGSGTYVATLSYHDLHVSDFFSVS